MLILGIGLFIFVLADVQVISTSRPGIDPPGPGGCGGGGGEHPPTGVQTQIGVME